MARKPRIHYAGALYHVMLRGNAGQTVFHEHVKYRYFEDILAQFGRTESDARAAYLHFMGQTTQEELLTQLRHGNSTKGRILGNENFIKAALRYQGEPVLTQIAIAPLVDEVARVCGVSPREMTSASRERHMAEARAMAALVGIDHFGHPLSDFARYFNRDIPALSKQVKALRNHLKQNQSLQDKMTHIQYQITTIRKA